MLTLREAAEVLRLNSRTVRKYIVWLTPSVLGAEHFVENMTDIGPGVPQTAKS